MDRHAGERERFRAVTDTLRDTVGTTLTDLAVAFGVSLPSVVKWRQVGGVHRPHSGWQRVVHGLAEHGAANLRRKAVEAEALAARLTNQPPSA